MHRAVLYENTLMLLLSAELVSLNRNVRRSHCYSSISLDNGHLWEVSTFQCLLAYVNV